MTREREVRVVPLAGFEVRSVGEKLSFEGYAALFGRLSEPLWGFRERVRPGAFARTLAASPDVRMLFNHDANLPLARTTNGTLRLAEDSAGLHAAAELAPVSYARDLSVLVERRDVSQMSFGFFTIADAWSSEDGEAVRELLEVSLDGGDVSPVTFPAYPDTTAEVRARMGAPGGGTDAGALGVDARALAAAIAEAREGKVLSEANAVLVREAIASLEALLASAEPARSRRPLALARRELELALLVG